MLYSYRPNLLQTTQRIRLTETCFELLDSSGQVKRSVPLTAVRQIREFDHHTIRDQKNRAVTVKAFTITVTQGRSITLKSASQTGFSVGRDHRKEYDRFVKLLIERLKVEQPDVRLITGTLAGVVLLRAVGLLGWLLTLGGVGLLAASFVRGLSADKLILAAGCCVIGFAIATFSFRLARHYIPASRVLRDCDDTAKAD